MSTNRDEKDEVYEQVEGPRPVTVIAVDPAESSLDGLYDYYLEQDDFDYLWRIDVVGPLEGPMQEAVSFSGFASRASALVWIAAHARSSDLGEFALVRSSRAMHHWARHTSHTLNVMEAEGLVERGGLLPVG